MDSHGGKDTAQEQSAAEMSAQVAVGGPASAGGRASPSAEKVHKKHNKKRTKSADVQRDGCKSPESLGDSSPGRGKKAKREPKAKSNDPAPQPSHDMSPKPLPPPQAFVENPAAPSVAAAPCVHGAPKPVDHDTHPAARDVPELREFGNSLPMIEQRRPNKSIIPMIASVGIICLMLVIIISMLVSNRRRARAAGTNTATPATMIDDGVEMTATSATITVVTGSENATSSHSHETVPEQT
ncbi:uncharacterized protein LOC125941107 [Dermacentor silvarum]|uniref:uncharacterized protein LOC125941107 n=1 Tax=Dermacentor silvarum TaxID=543639 RepID=UPI002100F722|nr:uncharacterized protein LOC125941107 [Dermacentor silvarum]